MFLFSFFFALTQLSFAATASTIDSGAIAERMKFLSYIMLSAAMTAFTQPIVGHWIWHKQGWLHKLGFIDFAGTGGIHMLGGFSALVAAKMLGKRRLFSHIANKDIRFIFQDLGNPVHTVYGGFILFVSWISFNSASIGVLSESDHKERVGLVCVNTLLGGASGAIGGSILSLKWHKNIRPNLTVNCLLGGLVSITGVCNAMHPFFAILCGFMAVPVLVIAQEFVIYFGIDGYFQPFIYFFYFFF